jgi:hypothetical protein
MTTYAVLLPGDESYWDTASDDERQAGYARHEAFAKALAERGHVVTGGAELTHSRGTKVVRRAGEELTVTDGPYAETAEQLTGFYLVQSDDLDDLIEICKILSPLEGGIEVRACVDHSAGDSTT